MKTGFSDYTLFLGASDGKQTDLVQQAVILAAGKGLRLQVVQKENPKCLIDLGPAFLIEYQIWVLRLLGVKEICVVVGYKGDRVRDVVRPWGCHCITNDRYEQTNSLYSLWLTRQWVRDTFLLCNGDVLAHPWIYKSLADGPSSCFTYDSSSGADPEHMKVTLRQGRLRAVGKDLPLSQVSGENVGILKFTQTALEPLFDGTRQILQTIGDDAWAPQALGAMAQQEPIIGIDVAGIPWIEIDFPTDLEYALNRVWPEIKKCFVPNVGGKEHGNLSSINRDLPDSSKRFVNL